MMMSNLNQTTAPNTNNPNEDSPVDTSMDSTEQTMKDVSKATTITTTEDEHLDEKIINEEYKVWKMNAPYLYDLVITHALEWPSLTVQWMPEIERPEGGDHFTQRLLLGTHTSDDEPNYLQLATVQLPKSLDKAFDSTTNATAAVSTNSQEQNQQAGALKPFGMGGGECKIKVSQRISHDGEVNRARYLPQNPCILASRTSSGEVHCHDYTKHSSEPADVPSPDIRLIGQSKEGYGLSWNPLQKGLLAGASEDGSLCVWDIKAACKDRTTLKPLHRWLDHGSVVEDCCWNEKNANILLSVGDDNRIFIWDITKPEKWIHCVEDAHQKNSEINCCSFNPWEEHMFATGGTDSKVLLWDMRKLNEGPMHVLEGHSGDVLQIQWSPHTPGVLASSGNDRRILVWDLNRIGREQDAEDAEDGPPELLFVHGGHTAKVSDLSWNPQEPWVLASVAEDNICQIWQMSSSIYEDEERDNAGLTGTGSNDMDVDEDVE